MANQLWLLTELATFEKAVVSEQTLHALGVGIHCVCKMKFECKNIEIRDEEFGCTITFSDRKGDTFEGEITVQKAIDSLGKYVMLQRTYGEDEREGDYYYVEFSEYEDSGELTNFQINLTRSKFLMQYRNKIIELDLNVSADLYSQIEEALSIITNNRGSLKIEE